MYVSGYAVISFIVVGVELFLALSVIGSKSRTAKLFAATAMSAAFVTMSYMASLFAPNYFFASAASSAYFVGVDAMLLSFTGFTIYLTRTSLKKHSRIIFMLLNLWMLFELVIFAVNPFFELAISYTPVYHDILLYEYQPKLFFNLHLGYTYTLCASIVFLLVRKILQVPREYRITFVAVLLSLVAVVAFNALFLFLPNLGVLSYIDWSTWGYAIGIGAMYWSKFIYRKRGLLNRFKNEVFEGVDQGIALFDYTNHLMFSNTHTREMFPRITFSDELRYADFVYQCGIDQNILEVGSLVSVQIYGQTSDGSERPLRCDFRNLTNKDDRLIGKLFVFDDMSHTTDLLTGFQSFDSFMSLSESRGMDHPKNMTVVICDPNGLAALNQLYGLAKGDQLIRELSELMKKYFPASSYFVRGRDANLMVFCYNHTSAMVMQTMKEIKSEFSGSFQFAFADLNKYHENAHFAISAAEESLRTKKLLDKGSARSSMLTSLIQALQESDEGTEAHVQRTQILGERLADRIGLSDIERADLALLCLLHDIGKIGIPLEILNKPGKLTEDEWAVLRSHTEKGYQIALSSNELRGIAEMIKYHHEQWDGKGYPEGLSRESIPLLSRIIAVVDAYDAMISTRSYRKGMSKESAIEELRTHAGTQFDPFIVSEFIQMMTEGGADFIEQLATTQSEDALRMQGGDYLEQEPTPVFEPSEARVHAMNYTRYILSEDDVILFTDDNFERMTGYTAEDVREMNLKQFDLIPEEDRTEYLILVQEQTANNDMAYFEHRLLRKDGLIDYVFCMGRIYFDSAARAERSEIIVTRIVDTFAMKELTDIQEAKAQARLAQWEKTYRRDSLTGLLTHSAFRSDVESILLKGNCKVLYLMMDLDNFKQYNDTFGHQEGDEFLIFVAQSITSAMRSDDLASRLGGDEFAAVMTFPMEASDNDIMMRARRFFDAVSVSLRSSDKDCSVSMGAAISKGEGDTFNALYARADQALYGSKTSGRDKLTM